MVQITLKREGNQHVLIFQEIVEENQHVLIFQEIMYVNRV